MTDKVLLVFLIAAIVVVVFLWFVFREKPGSASDEYELEGPFQCPRCKGEGRVEKPDGKGKDWCPWCRGCGAIKAVPFVYDRVEECKKCSGAGRLRPPSQAYPDGSGAPGAEIKAQDCPDCRGGLVVRQNHLTYRWVEPYLKPPDPPKDPAAPPPDEKK